MMKLITTISELRQRLDPHVDRKESIGFVPTMGALHQGHLSLVQAAAGQDQVVVVSIFVNPTQFNDPRDLERYPRTLEQDLNLLSQVRCDYVFAPTVHEIYPEPDNRQFGFGALENVMEGKFRPGHFNGVAQVVSRLFDLVKPTRAYFGLKDFQQLAVIKQLVKKYNYPVEIVPCAIVREEDGLAMSSRNTLLLPEYRKAAPVIYASLQQAGNDCKNRTIDQVKESVCQTINSTGLLQVEYFEIVDDTTLQPVTGWNDPGQKVGCIAVFAGHIRLIDNIVF